MQTLDFLKLGNNTAGELAALSVPENEEHLICSNTQWIIQANYLSEAITFGAFRGDTAVAMISLIDPRVADDDDHRDQLQTGYLYIWRLMVGQHARRQGIGLQMIDFAQNYAQLVGLRGLSLTTADTETGTALPFYTKLGFVPTGRRLNGEIELLRR